MKKTKCFQIRMSYDLWKKIAYKAIDERLTQSELIRKILERYI